MKPAALLSLVLVVLVSGCSKSAKLDAPLEPLDAPSKIVTLRDLKGKVVLVDFWGTTCGPCRMTMPTIEQLYTAYRDKGFTVAGITNEDRQTVERFLAGSPIDYPVYLDGLDQAHQEFEVSNIPLAILIGKDGRILDTFEGAPLDRAKLEKEIGEALKQ